MALTRKVKRIDRICECGIVFSCAYANKILCKSCLNKSWRLNNKEKAKNSFKTCYSKNGEQYRLKNKEYKKHRLATDIEYRLRKNLRARISNFLKGKSKAGSAVSSLGCSVTEFKAANYFSNLRPVVEF